MSDYKAALESEQFSEQTIFLDAVTATGKSGVKRLPSRLPISVDLLITGAATVKLYVSNIESDKNGTRWGSSIRTFTQSEKIIIQDEPWMFWMFDVESISSGTVSVATGA